MNIAILDDSKEDLRQVKSVISSYYESQNTSADIHLYSSAEALPDPLNNPVQAVAEFQIYRADLRPYPCKDPCQEHPVRGYLPQCSSGTYHRCRHYTLLHNLPEIRRASGGNEMFSLLLQRLYRKYGSHREIHR